MEEERYLDMPRQRKIASGKLSPNREFKNHYNTVEG